MDRDQLRALGEQLLRQARALRSAFPDGAAVREVAIGTVPPESPCGAEAAFRAALRYLRDEMLLVRDGRAEGLGVLDDEIANAQHLLLLL